MNDPKHMALRHPRLVGVGLLVVGLFLAKWQIYDPLHAAELGRPEVHIYAILVALGVFLPPLGMSYLVFGRRASEWIQIDPQNLSFASVSYLLCFMGIGLTILFYVLSSLEKQGYRVILGN